MNLKQGSGFAVQVGSNHLAFAPTAFVLFINCHERSSGVHMRVLILLVVLGTIPLSAQRFVMPLPVESRVIRGMDWLEPDTTTMIGVGDAVIRSLPGEIFEGVLPKYESTSFESVAVINDSIGIATAFDGTIVGLDLKKKRVVELEGLPSHGMKVMRCGTTAIVRVDSSVLALTWTGSLFNASVVSDTFNVIAHCAVTDSTFAITTKDLQLIWMDLRTQDTLATKPISFPVIWMHPIHAQAVALYYANTGFETQSLDRAGPAMNISNSGPLRHLVGFTPRRSGEALVMQWTGEGMQSLVYGDSSRIGTDGAAGIKGEITNIKSIVTAGVCLPAGFEGGKHLAFSCLSTAIAYADTTLALMGTPKERLFNGIEDWIALHSPDQTFIAAMNERNGRALGVFTWSTDGGSTWSARPTPQNMAPLTKVVITNTRRIYAIVNNQLLYRFDPPAMDATIIGGINQGSLGLCPDITAHGDTLMVLTRDSITVSHDAGQTWIRKPYYSKASSTNPMDYDILYTEKNLVVLYSGPDVSYLVTTDWGTSWRQMSRAFEFPGPVWSFARASDGTWLSVASNESERYVLTTCGPTDTIFTNHDHAIGAVFEDWDGTLRQLTPAGLQDIDRTTWTIGDVSIPIRWPHKEPAHYVGISCMRPRSALMNYGLWLQIVGQPKVTSLIETVPPPMSMTPYPNPTGARLRSDLPIRKVYSTQGTIVWTGNNEDVSSIDVSSWLPGTYIVQTGSEQLPQYFTFIVVH
ncbi:MAG: T9SS type A sorting domain-containing protein [Bacteroidetes bacterium]|nr:T9SS type A sorting domain-containing protein [Bacteroidota bacterium]